MLRLAKTLGYMSRSQSISKDPLLLGAKGGMETDRRDKTQTKMKLSPS